MSEDLFYIINAMSFELPDPNTWLDNPNGLAIIIKIMLPTPHVGSENSFCIIIAMPFES